MGTLRTIVTWTTALLLMALAGGCHADPAAPPDWSRLLAGSWVAQIGAQVDLAWPAWPAEGGADCGPLEAVLNVAPSGEITGTWALPNGSCGSYAGTLGGTLARDVVNLWFTTSMGSNLFLELARRASCAPLEVAAGELAAGSVFTDMGGGRHLTLSVPVSLYLVWQDPDPFFPLPPLCVRGEGNFQWGAAPSQS
jgi:hypothetical protein